MSYVLDLNIISTEDQERESSLSPALLTISPPCLQYFTFPDSITIGACK